MKSTILNTFFIDFESQRSVFISYVVTFIKMQLIYCVDWIQVWKDMLESTLNWKK